VGSQSNAAMPVGREYMQGCGTARPSGCAEVGSQSNAAMPVGREYMQGCGTARPSGCAKVGAQSNAAMPMERKSLPEGGRGGGEGSSGAATLAPRRGGRGARGGLLLDRLDGCFNFECTRETSAACQPLMISQAPNTAFERSRLLPGRSAAGRILREVRPTRTKPCIWPFRIALAIKGKA